MKRFYRNMLHYLGTTGVVQLDFISPTPRLCSVQPGAQDPASPVQLAALPRFTNPSEAMADRSKVMCDGHFVLKRNKESRPNISFLTGSILSMSRKALINKGIKVKAGETFQYSQKKDCGFYIFEAGLVPRQVKVVKESIFVYLTCEEKRYVVGTLSSQHPRIQLNLFMNEDFLLTHSSNKRAVLFNGYQFSLRDPPLHPLSDCHLNTNKNFWAMEVEPYKDMTMHPRVDGKKYHILKVFIVTTTNDTIDVHVQFLNKFAKIGSLSSEEDCFSCDLEYDEVFTLSHTSKTTSVFVNGYTLPDIPLKKLPGPLVEKFNLKLTTNDKFDLIPPAKRSADPEYMAFVKRRGGAVQAPNLTAVSVVAAPLISFS